MPDYKRNIVIIGGGGHALSVVGVIQSDDINVIVGVIDPNPNNILTKSGFKYLGPSFYPNETGNTNGDLKYAAMGLGGFNNKKRETIYKEYVNRGFTFPHFVHHSASILYPPISCNNGTVIMAKAVIGPDVEVGENVIINTGVIIEHGCRIGNHVHIAPGAVICGDVRIGDRAFIGANATVIQGAVVPEDAFIKAGAVYV